MILWPAAGFASTSFEPSMQLPPVAAAAGAAVAEAVEKTTPSNSQRQAAEQERVTRGVMENRRTVGITARRYCAERAASRCSSACCRAAQFDGRTLLGEPLPLLPWRARRCQLREMCSEDSRSALLRGLRSGVCGAERCALLRGLCSDVGPGAPQCSPG